MAPYSPWPIRCRGTSRATRNAKRTPACAAVQQTIGQPTVYQPRPPQTNQWSQQQTNDPNRERRRRLLPPLQTTATRGQRRKLGGGGDCSGGGDGSKDGNRAPAAGHQSQRSRHHPSQGNHAKATRWRNVHTYLSQNCLQSAQTAIRDAGGARRTPRRKGAKTYWWARSRMASDSAATAERLRSTPLPYLRRKR